MSAKDVRRLIMNARLAGIKLPGVTHASRRPAAAAPASVPAPVPAFNQSSTPPSRDYVLPPPEPVLGNEVLRLGNLRGYYEETIKQAYRDVEFLGFNKRALRPGQTYVLIGREQASHGYFGYMPEAAFVHDHVHVGPVKAQQFMRHLAAAKLEDYCGKLSVEDKRGIVISVITSAPVSSSDGKIDWVDRARLYGISYGLYCPAKEADGKLGTDLYRHLKKMQPEWRELPVDRELMPHSESIMEAVRTSCGDIRKDRSPTPS